MIEVNAPSNIALIKYMGKEAHNIPTNSSLSYSLNHLQTRVQVEEVEEKVDRWEPLASDYPIVLNEKSQKRYLDFFEKLKCDFGIESNFLIKSANNFPSDCGLASSASSFAALSLACYELALKQRPQRFFDQGFTGDISLDRRFLSSYSRTGSGSSCRSFYNAWSVWEGNSAIEIELPFSNLRTMAVIVEAEKKEVSSSEAHHRVKTSLLMDGRTKRASLRLAQLLEAFQLRDWEAAFQLTWAEFWDMHSLFETSSPSFSYMTEGSLKVLKIAKEYWRTNKEGPLVTMDAGPNVHLLFREDQDKDYQFLLEILSQDFTLWTQDGKFGK